MRAMFTSQNPRRSSWRVVYATHYLDWNIRCRASHSVCTRDALMQIDANAYVCDEQCSLDLSRLADRNCLKGYGTVALARRSRFATHSAKRKHDAN